MTWWIEIALFAEESGNVYQSYVKINYSVPKQVQLLTGFTNRTIETPDVPFRNAKDGLLELIHGYLENLDVNETIIITNLCTNVGHVYELVINVKK